MATETIVGINITELVEEIHNIVKNSRNRITTNINTELLLSYWNIGKIIIEKETNSQIDNQTSRKIILQISKILTERLGKGFSRANLFNMRKFYLIYPDVQTLSGQMSWSKYCELLIISEPNRRAFLRKGMSECKLVGQGIKTADKQFFILFERLLYRNMLENLLNVWKLDSDPS